MFIQQCTLSYYFYPKHERGWCFPFAKCSVIIGWKEKQILPALTAICKFSYSQATIIKKLIFVTNKNIMPQPPTWGFLINCLRHLQRLRATLVQSEGLKALSAKPIKWPNTLCLTILWGWRLKTQLISWKSFDPPLKLIFSRLAFNIQLVPPGNGSTVKGSKNWTPGIQKSEIKRRISI